MKALLIISAVLICISCWFISQNHQAGAVPVAYNVSSISANFASYTRNNFDLLVDSGYNGTVNAVYQGRNTNNTLNYEFGSHPTLTLTVYSGSLGDGDSSLIPSTDPTLPINPVSFPAVSTPYSAVATIQFLHINNTNHNNGVISSVKIGTTNFIKFINKTVTCGVSICDSEIWILGNTTLVGPQTVTITPATTTTYVMMSSVTIFNNVRFMHPASTSSSNTASSTSVTTTLTPTFTGSCIVDSFTSTRSGANSIVSNNGTALISFPVAVVYGSSGSTAEMGSQYLCNQPASSRTLLWTLQNSAQWVDTSIDVVPIQNPTNFGFNLANTVSTGLQNMISNGSKVYYVGKAGNTEELNHIDVLNGVETHDWTIATPTTFCTESGGAPNIAIFLTQNHLLTYCGKTNVGVKTWSGGNTTSAVTGGITSISDMKIVTSGSIANGDKFTSNATGFNTNTVGSNQCELTFMSTNTTTPIDNIACDKSIPNEVKRYWNGILHSRIGGYTTNSTLPFLSSVDASIYKKQLTVPSAIYGLSSPNVKLIGHWDRDYLLSVSSGTINYIPMSTLTTLFSQNRAFQSYDLTLPSTESDYKLSPSSVSPVQQIKLYGQTINVTVSKYGMVTLPSGYTMRTTATSESVVRTIDPRWTNLPTNDIPAITTQSSLFPILITITNAPTDSSLMLVDSSQVIQNVNSVWCVVQLDTTHSTECDIPPGQCPLVYVADISTSPTIYNFEGTVCATGPNSKTIAYTNTLPLTFYTTKFAATHSFTPTTNGLSVTVRANTGPFTYNILIKNSTGAITQNFTKTINGTIDTHSFNVTNASKAASLSVIIPGTGQIYTAYLGSPLSLASVASFFHTYLSYQGFDFLSFIPLIFASMFTRNTVGIGAALVVVTIATLSWLSIVVVPDTSIFIMIIVAAIGMIGYRGIYG